MITLNPSLTCNAKPQVLPVSCIVTRPVRSEAASTWEGGPATDETLS
jgi:hypothetical protein